MKKKNYGKRTKMPTTFSNKCIILADLWLNYRGDEAFQDFIEYNDIGLPLAYMIANGLVESSETGNDFVEEAWGLFLNALAIEDSGFDSLDEMFDLVDEE